MGFFDADPAQCEACGLSGTCKHPEMVYAGRGEKRILLVTEAPTAAEDASGGYRFSGVDSLYADFMRRHGVNPETDCWKTSAVRCYPPKSRAVKPKELRACADKLQALLQKLRPVKVFVFGKTALEALIGDRVQVGAFSRWTGRAIPDAALSTTIYPFHAPAYIVASGKRDYTQTPLYSQFQQQLKAALDHVPEKSAVVFKKYHSKLSDLQGIHGGVWAVDFETTGLKPHAAGHKVVCVALSNGTDTICTRVTAETVPEIKRILADPDIKKVAHNLKFEDSWARHVLGVQVQGWFWDTMLAAHAIDNRGGVCGLKFQTYCSFGVGGYDDAVAPYMESGQGCNAFNKIEQCPDDILLRYCAEDAFYTYHLCSRQYQQVPPGFLFFLEGAKELSIVESNGIRIDGNRLKAQRQRLRADIEEKTLALHAMPEVVAWEAANQQTFNHNSPLQLRSFFKDAGEKFWKETDSGADSVDREVLAGFKSPVAKMILKIRAQEKIEGTFLAGIEDETVDGVLHPFYSLAHAATYRSSSSNPNFQNFPVRDKVALRIIRGNFKPSPGNQLMEVDYAGIEVRIAAAYTGDKNLLEYVRNPETDMHRDTAALIFKLPQGEVSKAQRQFAKGGFVFPAFYGSWYKQMAEAMWRDMEPDWKKDLAGRGIRTAMQFESHIKTIEGHFWGTRFSEYAEWKRRQWQRYQRDLKLGSHTGFVYTDIMDRKMVSNYPIQGSAFHCLLWSLIQTNRWLRKEKLQTKIVGTIHDSMVLDVVPAELDRVKQQVRKISCEDLRAHWDWITVPLDIDAKISAVDGTWHEMEPTEI